MILAAGFFWYGAPEIARDEMRGAVATTFTFVADAAYWAGRLLRDPIATTTTVFGRDPETGAPPNPRPAHRARAGAAARRRLVE